jgi:hypothetical protein
MPGFPEGYASYEAWIESKAGACPPPDDWPMPPIPEWSEELQTTPKEAE